MTGVSTKMAQSIKDKYNSFINSYDSVRKISKKEIKLMNNAMIAAGLRFYFQD